MIQWFHRQLERFGLAGGQAEALAVSEQEMAQVSLLLVDDTPENIQVLMETLKPLGHKLLAARDGETALTVARRARPAVILLDVMMPKIDGFEVCRQLKADPELAQAAVIFCSALDDTASKVKGLALGAVDFVTKPFQPEEVVARVNTHLAAQQLARSLMSRNQALARELAVARAGKQDALHKLGWVLLGESTPLRQLRAAIDAAAVGDEPVLLRSAPACGAEVVARVIHGNSSRRDRAFILVDGARLATGAGSAASAEGPMFSLGGQEPSRLELADGGTLFIDQVDRLAGSHIEELAEWAAASAEARAAGRRPSPDVRVIAVSNLLEGAALPTRYPAGLRGELSKVTISLPTLAERRDDVLVLATEILSRQGRSMGRRFEGFDPESVERMTAHAWPDNLRELEDVVVRSAMLAPPEATRVHVNAALLQSGVPLGRYNLVRRLGAGGSGEVWAARHQLLARPAAVKFIRGSAESDPDVVERFRREATATAALASPHTVTLYDFGVSDQGQFYYVMELLDGIDLDQMLTRHGPLDPARLAHFMVHACRSLSEAHARGMIHRDLKPSNLFACRLGLEVDVLKLLDFGLVRQTQSTESKLTQKNALVGTPDFMAPESVTGTEENDGRTDVYSLAASAYTLASGQPLFSGAHPMAILIQHVQKAPTPLTTVAPKVPEALANLIMAGLAKSPGDRPTAQQLMNSLLATGLPQQWDEDARQSWWQLHMVAPNVGASHAATRPTMLHTME